jgi:DME family drug/metabolite transporter
VPSSGRSRPVPGGAIAVVAAAALWGTTGSAAHFAPAGATPVAIGAARIAAGGGMLLLVGLLSKGAGSDRHGQAPRRGAELLGLLAAGGRRRLAVAAGALAVAGYQLCFFAAVRLTGIAIGTLVAIGSGPVWAGLIGVLTGAAGLDRRWLLATVAAIGGCAVLLAGGRSAGVQLDGVVLGLAAGCCYACYALTAGWLITTGTGHRAVMAALFGGGAVGLLPVLLTSADGWLLTGRGLAVLAELSVLATVAAYLLYGHGLRTVPAASAVTFGLAEPVVATGLAVIIAGERLHGAAVAGLALIGCALAVLAAPRRTASRLRDNHHHG